MKTDEANSIFCRAAQDYHGYIVHLPPGGF